jgi:hypothetical protein
MRLATELALFFALRLGLPAACPQAQTQSQSETFSLQGTVVNSVTRCGGAKRASTIKGTITSATSLRERTLSA